MKCNLNSSCPVHVQNQLTIKNRKAFFNYKLLEFFTVGIVLCGTEIKSIRLGKTSLVESYCLIIENELWIRNLYIAEYFYGTYRNHNVLRDRKLLIRKKELKKISEKKRNIGFAIIPVKLFFNEKGLAKLSIALAKGKKMYDKRHTLKEKEDQQQMAKMFKYV